MVCKLLSRSFQSEKFFGCKGNTCAPQLFNNKNIFKFKLKFHGLFEYIVTGLSSIKKNSVHLRV